MESAESLENQRLPGILGHERSSDNTTSRAVRIPPSPPREPLKLQGLIVISNYLPAERSCDRNGHAVFLFFGVFSMITGSFRAGRLNSPRKLKNIWTLCLRLPLDLSGAWITIFCTYSFMMAGVNAAAVGGRARQRSQGHVPWTERKRRKSPGLSARASPRTPARWLACRRTTAPLARLLVRRRAHILWSGRPQYISAP